MRTRLAASTLLTVTSLVLITGCSAPSVTDGKERGAPAFDPFRAARTTEVAPSSQLYSAPKSAPTRVVVPALGIDMPVEPHGVDGAGQMSLPENIFTAGWYESGSSPNRAVGSTVIAAHVDSRVQGVGPFAALRTATPGTEVTIADAAGDTHTYRVVSVVKLEKTTIDWSEYVTLTGEPELILVTCGGAFIEDVRNYTDNYIVTAEKVS